MSRNLFLVFLTCASYMLLLILNLEFVKGQQQDDALCPKILKQIPNLCDRVKCINNITKEDCPLDTFFMEKLTMCECCPGCARYIGIEPGIGPKVLGNCNNNASAKEVTRQWDRDCEGPLCPVIINKCMPGLECNTTSGFCVEPTRTQQPCTEECMYKKTLKRIGRHHWDPECESDGSYSPKQCKGDHVTGLCYCVDPCGKRIFGSTFRAKSENQTCACSRQANHLRSIGNTATLHCTSDGNYEGLQCDTDSGLCYCVEEKTGKMNGAVVPQQNWKMLPCLTPNVTNFMKDGKYLRKCESEYAASSTIIRDGKIHGTEVSMRALNCDYDGSYAPVQKRGTRMECVYKNGTTIKDFFTASIAEDRMDCNCARDEFLYKTTGRPFSYGCAGQTGNYASYYDFGSYASCVDRDGVPYGDLVPSKYVCCLDETCILITAQKCYNKDNNPSGLYRSCCHWPYGGECKK